MDRYPTPGNAETELGTETGSATDQQLCYHLLGTPQSEDVLIYAIPAYPMWMMGAGITEDGRWVSCSSESCPFSSNI